MFYNAQKIIFVQPISPINKNLDCLNCDKTATDKAPSGVD